MEAGAVEPALEALLGRIEPAPVILERLHVGVEDPAHLVCSRRPHLDPLGKRRDRRQLVERAAHLEEPAHRNVAGPFRNRLAPRLVLPDVESEHPGPIRLMARGQRARPHLVLPEYGGADAMPPPAGVHRAAHPVFAQPVGGVETQLLSPNATISRSSSATTTSRAGSN